MAGKQLRKIKVNLPMAYLQPWPRRNPQHPHHTEHFLLHPYRKPKRVRTAFSPSQLLKLEHAFESNHYVVGAERKTLAQALSLTETQVKVWFQNRRTKHKRMQQEEDSKGGGGGGHSKNSSSPGHLSYDEDELIDMEMDDECPSDEEEEHQQQLQQQQQQQQQHQQHHQQHMGHM